VIDRTAAALASALPVDLAHPKVITHIAQRQAERLAESGWRLVHADDRPQTFAEHTAEALALIHDHVELHDLDDVIAELGIDLDERGEAK
jgi:hypothetical protein